MEAKKQGGSETKEEERERLEEVKKNQTLSIADHTSIKQWCSQTLLDDVIAEALNRHHYTELADVEQMTEQQIDLLQELSWRQKAKLWVALESYRLEKFYEKSHNSLTDILKILHG